MRDPYEVLGIRPDATDTEVKNAYRRLARKYHPDNYASDPAKAEEAEEMMKEINAAYDEIQARRSGKGTHSSEYGFTDVRHALFHRDRVFTPEEYVQLLGTYSDHIAIEETVRNRFFGKIADAIRRHGGTITICDTMDLELARKP